MLEEKEFIRKLAEALRRARAQKGYTGEKLAEESGLDYSTMNLIENGRQNPRIYTLYKLFYALDIDVEEFFTTITSEHGDRKQPVLDRLKRYDIKTLESVDTLLRSYRISKK